MLLQTQRLIPLILPSLSWWNTSFFIYLSTKCSIPCLLYTFFFTWISEGWVAFLMWRLFFRTKRWSHMCPWIFHKNTIAQWWFCICKTLFLIWIILLFIYNIVWNKIAQLTDLEHWFFMVAWPLIYFPWIVVIRERLAFLKLFDSWIDFPIILICCVIFWFVLNIFYHRIIISLTFAKLIFEFDSHIFPMWVYWIRKILILLWQRVLYLCLKVISGATLILLTQLKLQISLDFVWPGRIQIFKLFQRIIFRWFGMHPATFGYFNIEVFFCFRIICATCIIQNLWKHLCHHISFLIFWLLDCYLFIFLSLMWLRFWSKLIEIFILEWFSDFRCFVNTIRIWQLLCL